MVPSTDERINAVEALIEQYRWARDLPQVNADRRLYDVLRSHARELRARRAGVPSVAEVELGRRMEAVRRSKTSLGYDGRRMNALAEEVLNRWETIAQALRLLEEWSRSDGGEVGEQTRGALDRWRYAFCWHRVNGDGGEANARFNWAAGEDSAFTMADFEDVDREFLRTTGRSTIKGVVQR